MSVSSDGVLYFGFPIGEDDQMPDFMGETEYFDDWLDAKAGLEDASYEVRDANREACPADLMIYCSCDYPMYFLAVRGCALRANRGDAKEVMSEFLAVPSEKIAAFKGWCEANEIPYQEPKWFLCSMYG